jgi:hypothetical protein
MIFLVCWLWHVQASYELTHHKRVPISIGGRTDSSQRAFNGLPNKVVDILISPE